MSRRMRHKRRRGGWIAAIVLVIVLLAGFFTWLGWEVADKYLSRKADKEAEKYVDKPASSDEAVYILALGTDERLENERARTDTIMIFRLDPKTKEVRLLSIPRDTYVDIPGRGKDKVNHAHAFGGIPLTLATVKKFTGLPIHYYVRTNFEGFKDIVDTLGGVTIYVEKDMVSGSGKYAINLKKGYHRLNGEQALQYVRFRHDPQGDIGRIERQQKFIKAVLDEMMQSGTLLKLPTLLPQLQKAVETNMTITDALRLKKMVEGGGEMKRYSIPGEPLWLNGISYWKPDMQKTREVIREFSAE
ncbi:MAG: polyisoprenyl-teichoic acid--peptidoglycan teichoic acid transferase [Eubacteriales bacterium]|nr:polyisoprenyl-teichoic acid--peptidoglycan teichoic acid transferase [Eubacteriales bacterium]